MLIIGHSVGWTLYGPKNKKIAERNGPADLAAHHQNFLDCVWGGAKVPTADVITGTVRRPWSTWLISGCALGGSSILTRRPYDRRRLRSRVDGRPPLPPRALGGTQTELRG